MASNDVKLGAGLATGMFYHAPKGTALPTYPTETLAEAWKEVGYVAEDGITWQWDKAFSGGGRAYCGSNSDYEQAANDDWLLSPPINLERGATYRVTFDANTYTGANVSYLELAYGQGLRPERYDIAMPQLTIATPVTDTVILIKGSRGIQMERVLDRL